MFWRLTEAACFLSCCTLVKPWTDTNVPRYRRHLPCWCLLRVFSPRVSPAQEAEKRKCRFSHSITAQHIFREFSVTLEFKEAPFSYWKTKLYLGQMVSIFFHENICYHFFFSHNLMLVFGLTTRDAVVRRKWRNIGFSGLKWTFQHILLLKCYGKVHLRLPRELWD